MAHRIVTAPVQPVRLQLSRRKGFDLQAASRAINDLPAVNVARPTRWGNPFKVGSWVRPLEGGLPVELKTASAAVALFTANARHPTAGFVFRRNVREQLAGKNLACFCKPGDCCHADVLLALANALPQSEGK